MFLKSQLTAAGVVASSTMVDSGGAEVAAAIAIGTDSFKTKTSASAAAIEDDELSDLEICC